jgi:hypothetical protein
MHNEELHNLCSSHMVTYLEDKCKLDEIGGSCSTRGGGFQNIYVKKPEGYKLTEVFRSFPQL